MDELPAGSLAFKDCDINAQKIAFLSNVVLSVQN